MDSKRLLKIIKLDLRHGNRIRCKLRNQYDCSMLTLTHFGQNY